MQSYIKFSMYPIPATMRHILVSVFGFSLDNMGCTIGSSIVKLGDYVMTYQLVLTCYGEDVHVFF